MVKHLLAGIAGTLLLTAAASAGELFADRFEGSDRLLETLYTSSSVEVVSSEPGGVTSFEGGHYGLIRSNSDRSGPYKNFFDGNRSDDISDSWPGEFRVRTAFYLDPSVATSQWGFDYRAVLEGSTPADRRTYYFNVRRQNSGGLYIRASTKAIGIGSQFKGDEIPSLYRVDTVGWFNFEFLFSEADSGDLSVDWSLYEPDGTRIGLNSQVEAGLSVATDVKGLRSIAMTELVAGNGVGIDAIVGEIGPFDATAVPAPGAATGGLAMLGLVATRRRRTVHA